MKVSGFNHRRPQKITAYQASDRPGFVVNFVHPQTEKRVSRSLQTRDPQTAKQIALDLERLAVAPALWVLQPEDPQLLTFHLRALEIFFDRPVTRALARNGVSPELRSAMVVLAEAGLIKHIGRIEQSNEVLDRERELRMAAEKRVHCLEREKQDLELELQRYRRAANKHTSATLQEALDRFAKIYPVGHAKTTARMVVNAVTRFVTATGGQSNLGKIKAGLIDAWIRAYKTADGEDVAAITRKRRKAYLSIFWRWAVREYDLAENPMSKTEPIAGVQRYPENIRAVRRLDEITVLLESLKPWPYWRAWVATAILAGPRWSEQAWLKVDDLYPKEGYLRIATRTPGPQAVGTKTGRERNIPIEKTVLLPILEEYVAAHTGRFPWLFPSLLERDVPRTQTPQGLWSGSSAFLDAWRPVATLAQQRSAGTGEFWNYGPSEWRHTFGTALGMCGFSSLEISRLMGNSATIAERHYVAIRPQDAGHRWPFKWI